MERLNKKLYLQVDILHAEWPENKMPTELEYMNIEVLKRLDPQSASSLQGLLSPLW